MEGRTHPSALERSSMGFRLRQSDPASVAQIRTLFYSGLTRGSDSCTRMQRLTARLLLLLTLGGTVIPLALAATTAPPHACCLRKAHKCHDSTASESNQLALRSTGCCNQDCCHAVTTSQSACPQPGITSAFAQNVDLHTPGLRSSAPAAALIASQSTRAPPQVSLA
jgi:hypothetical protein